MAGGTGAAGMTRYARKLPAQSCGLRDLCLTPPSADFAPNQNE
jgi:hypothetical protein